MSRVDAVHARLGVVRSRISDARRADGSLALALYTFATAHTVESHNFQSSCARIGLPLTVVGTSVPWRSFQTKIEGYRDLAVAHAADAAAAGVAPPLVFVMDAYDVVCTKELAPGVSAPAALEAAFTALGRDMVVSAERVCLPMNCKPLTRWWAAQPAVQHDGYKYLNSGLVAARADALADAWTWVHDNGHADDQLGLAAWAEQNVGRVWLDAERVLFQNRFSRGDPLAGYAAWFTHCPGALGDSKDIHVELQRRYVGDDGIVAESRQGAYLLLELLGFGSLAVAVVVIVVAAALLARRCPPPSPPTSVATVRTSQTSSPQTQRRRV